MSTATEALSGEQIVDLCRRHTLFEWSAQAAVDPIPMARAKGVYFWTPEDKRFIDFNSQLMCVNIGHGDERVIRAIQDQAAVLAYANPFMATEPRARLGAKLAEITPGDIDTFFFTNGGAEANENAVKIARFVTGRHKILARYRSYHGGTYGAITLTGKWFAVDHWGVVPDLITMAKGLTSAYVQLGAVGMRRKYAEHFTDKVFYGGLTYNSHPLACAAALANLQIY